MWAVYVREPTARANAVWRVENSGGGEPGTSQLAAIMQFGVQVHMNGVQCPANMTRPKMAVGLTGWLLNQAERSPLLGRFSASAATRGSNKAHDGLRAAWTIWLTCHMSSSSAHTAPWLAKICLRDSTSMCWRRRASTVMTSDTAGGGTETSRELASVVKGSGREEAERLADAESPTGAQESSTKADGEPIGSSSTVGGGSASMHSSSGWTTSKESWVTQRHKLLNFVSPGF